MGRSAKKVLDDTFGEGKYPAHWGGKLGPDGLDRTPVEMPVGYDEPLSLEEMIAKFVATELQSSDDEFETWEEADDFEIEDAEQELLDMSPYTLTDVQDEVPPEYQADAAPAEQDAPPASDSMPRDPEGDQSDAEGSSNSS